MNAKLADNKKKFILSILSGTIVAISITIVLILLFALLIKFVNISDSWIFPINQVIKVISLFLGTMITLKKVREKGLVIGLIMGLAYYIFSFIIFSILQGSFAIALNNLYDLLLTTIMGGLIGIISINFVK